MLRASLVSSLFPQLANRSRAPFRVAFLVYVVLLLALALAKLEPAVIAASAFGVPFLFVCYIAEIDPAEKRFMGPAAGVLLVGAGLGVAFALLLGPRVSDGLEPTLSPTLTSTTVLGSAVLAPVISGVLMVLPVAVLRLQRPDQSKALDGFTAGALSGLGFATALTLTELASRVQEGNIMQGPVLTVLSSAVVRGVSLPLVAAGTAGYVGATLWSRPDHRSELYGSPFASPLFAFMFALVLLVGLGFADDAGLSDTLLLLVHLFAAALAMLALRAGVHHLLLVEQRDVSTGHERLCPHCLDTVPAMSYCPTCGVAEQATALYPLSLIRAHRRHDAERPSKTLSQRGTGRRAEVEPTSPGAVQTAIIRPGSDHEVRSLGRLGTGHLVAALLAALAVGAGVLVALGAVVPEKAAAACVSLRCFSPFGPVPVRHGVTYTSAQGWGVTWYPAREVVDLAAPLTSVESTADQLRLDFSSSKIPAEDGALVFLGGPADGKSASQLVTALQQANAPNAVQDYVLPGATVGYEIGYGEAFATTPNSFLGDDVTYEVVISCAVVNAYAVCAYGVGPQVAVDRFVNHPTPSKLMLSLWSDPDVNGVFWKGHPVP